MGQIVAVAPHRVDYLFVEIIERLRHAGHEVLRCFEPAAFVADPGVLATADVLVAIGELPVGRQVLAAGPKLRAVISPYTGMSGFDVAAANEADVLLANGHAAENYESMAEATIMLMLALLYDLHGSETNLRENRPRGLHTAGRMLQGQTIGLIGFGQMGQALARRLAGWQVHLQTYSPRTPPDIRPDIARVPLESLLRTSDVVCVVTALTAQTRDLLDAQHLALLKPDAVLINTGRGGIVNEAALVALAAQRPGMRIALDVFETEPLPPDNPLRRLAGAILTPHMVGHTRQSVGALQNLTVESVLACLAGEPPRYTRNPEILPRWRQRWGVGGQVGMRSGRVSGVGSA
jgi:D-3-phosphoglycerate dehydrogenase